MKLTKATIDLICDLERIIGDECYNPNSYDGWTLEEGRAYRYPVCYKDMDDEEIKTKYKIVDMDKDHIYTIRYQFGSNYLFIGNAIVNVLECLEKKFDLNINDLLKKKK